MPHIKTEIHIDINRKATRRIFDSWFCDIKDIPNIINKIYPNYYTGWIISIDGEKTNIQFNHGGIDPSDILGHWIKESNMIDWIIPDIIINLISQFEEIKPVRIYNILNRCSNIREELIIESMIKFGFDL